MGSVSRPSQAEIDAYTAGMCGPLEPLPVAVVMSGPVAYAKWIAEIVECKKCRTWHTRATGAQRKSN